MFHMNCKLDYYLSKEGIIKNLKKKQVNDLPEIESILSKIKDFLEEYKYSNCITYGEQIYDHTFYLPNGEYATFYWDASKAKFLAEELNLPIQDMSVAKLASKISVGTIDPAYLKSGLKNNEPVIVAEIFIFDTYIILDGNHRIISRYKKGINSVKGYWLQPMYHFFSMPTDTSRALYTGLSTAKCISDYLVGDLSKDDLYKSIDELDTFYDISAQKEMLDRHNRNFS